MSKDEFLKLLSPVLLKVYDEHTSIDFSYKYDSLQKFMPIKVRWINGIPYIEKNLLQNPAIIPGSRIIEINGKDPNALYNEIKTSYPNYTTDNSLEYEVYSLHFDYLYASFFEQPDSFTIVAEAPVTNKRYTVHSPCVLRSDSLHFMPIYELAQEYMNSDSCFTFSMDTAYSTAIIKISSMAPGCADFPVLYKNAFDSIFRSNAQNLVIDLRYDRGGDPKYGAMLLTYLYNKPFRIFDSLSAIMKKKPTYFKYIDTTDTEFDTWNETIAALNSIQQPNSSWYTSFRDSVFFPEKNIFQGKTYLLVNTEVHSAASITTSLLDYLVKPVILGTPVCGPYNSGNALDMMTLTLPNSGLMVNIPIVYYRYAIPRNSYPYKKGVLPDIFVKPEISDILSGEDVVMDSTMALIERTH